MADDVPRAEGLRTTFWSHTWHSYDDYLNVHYRHISALANSGKVLRDGLSIIETRDGKELLAVNIRGHIECASDVLIFVDKWLEARRNQHGHYEVQGYSYSYHAWIRNSETTLLRYDTAHGLDGLHCHRLDTKTYEESCETDQHGESPDAYGLH